MEIIIAIGIMAWLLVTALGSEDSRCRRCGRRHKPHPVPARRPEPIGTFDPHEDLMRQINKAWAETHPVPPSPVMLPVLQPGESLEVLRSSDGRIVRYVVVRD